MFRGSFDSNSQLGLGPVFWVDLWYRVCVLCLLLNSPCNLGGRVVCADGRARNGGCLMRTVSREMDDGVLGMEGHIFWHVLSAVPSWELCEHSLPAKRANNYPTVHLPAFS